MKKKKIFFAILRFSLCAALAFCLSSCLVIDDGLDEDGGNSDGTQSGGVTTSPPTESGGAIDIKKKRGFCFEKVSDAQVDALTSGGKIAWAYNWGTNPQSKNASSSKKIGAGEVAYFPMLWGGVDGEKDVRAYLDANKGTVKYLLGFNEPNMSGNDGGCSMLPKTAADLWSRLEKIAEEYGLSLVSPAMTYSGATLSDGKVYNTPESWLDEFIKEYKAKNGKEPRMDYLALHSYMMWAGSVNEGYANKYAEMYGRKIFMTEFCSWWDNEGKENSEAVQVQEMSQKIEAMDQNPNVAGYAWFMADGNYGARPWNSLFKGKTSSELSLAGKVYAYLGNTAGRKFAPGEEIPVYEYTTSSNYEKSGGQNNGYKKQWKAISENTDGQSKDTVQFVLTFQTGNYANYAVDVPEDGEYKVTVRQKPKNSGEWKSVSSNADLKKGAQMLKYTADEEQTIAWIKFEKK